MLGAGMTMVAKQRPGGRADLALPAPELTQLNATLTLYLAVPQVS